jgi:hypothetical protein
VTEGSRAGWHTPAALGTTMMIVGLLISSDYLINVDVPFLASGLSYTGGVIVGMTLRRLMTRKPPGRSSADRRPMH